MLLRARDGGTILSTVGLYPRGGGATGLRGAGLVLELETRDYTDTHRVRGEGRVRYLGWIIWCFYHETLYKNDCMRA